MYKYRHIHVSDWLFGLGGVCHWLDLCLELWTTFLFFIWWLVLQWDFSGYSRISGLRHPSENKHTNKGVEIYFECGFSLFKIQTLTQPHSSLRFTLIFSKLTERYQVFGYIVKPSIIQSVVLFTAPQWEAADTEIKVPSGENAELKCSPFRAWRTSVYSHTCYAYCQEFIFLLLSTLPVHSPAFFFRTSPDFSCVGHG